MEAELCLPSDIGDALWDFGTVLLHPLSDFRRGPIVPRRLTQNAARSRVTGFGDASGPMRAATGVLAGCQPEVRDELSWMAEPREVAGFRDDGSRNDRPNAFQGLQCDDELSPARLSEGQLESPRRATASGSLHDREHSGRIAGRSAAQDEGGDDC